jgi:hypothetical protein
MKKRITKDELVSGKDTLRGAQKTSVTSKAVNVPNMVPGRRTDASHPPKAGTRSQAHAEKNAGISSSGAAKVKNNPQVESKVTTRKNRSLG